MGTSFMALDPDTMGWGSVQDVVWAKGDIADRGPTYPILDSGSIFGSTTMSVASDAPVAFQSFYYLVRPFLCGTWLTQPATEPARDVYLP